MPVYNGERFLPEALGSLLSQTFADFELVVSDNDSTDRTAEIVLAAVAGDPRVRYHRNAANVGAAPNFNLVLELARGELFMWAASDDLWHPEYIRSLVSLLRESPEAVLAFCDFDNIDEEGRSVRENPHLFELPAKDDAQRLSNYLVQPEPWGKANLIYGLMRREAIVRAGGLTSWSGHEWGADMLVVFRLLSLGELRLSRDRMFHKRLVEPLLPLGRGTLWSRLGARREGLRGWRTYFEGYRRLIDMAEGPSAPQKAALHALARKRYREIRRSTVRTLGGIARRKVSRIVREWVSPLAP
jgi:glycosyltransferase involved in cell wall biosynthesis